MHRWYTVRATAGVPLWIASSISRAQAATFGVRPGKYTAASDCTQQAPHARREARQGGVSAPAADSAQSTACSAHLLVRRHDSPRRLPQRLLLRHDAWVPHGVQALRQVAPHRLKVRGCVHLGRVMRRRAGQEAVLECAHLARGERADVLDGEYAARQPVTREQQREQR